MKGNNLDIVEKMPITGSQQKPTESLTEYSGLLDKLAVPYMPDGHYLRVGEITQTQGWVLHLSVVKSQITELLSAVIPFLVAENVPFKLIKDELTAQWILEGHLGDRDFGKIIRVYPENDTRALEIAQRLVSITHTFRGPAIPTDALLGSVVYTRYGSFNPVLLRNSEHQVVEYIYNDNGSLIPDPCTIPFSLPYKIRWPFGPIASPNVDNTSKLLNKKFYPIETLKNDIKGKVIKVLYFSRFPRIKSCVIKQGCKDVNSDEYDRDMRTRLQWQSYLHNELSAFVPIPKVLDCFTENNDQYLAIEHVKGVPVFRFLSDVCQDRSWLELTNDLQTRILNIIINIVSIVNRLHQLGIVHRDITAENFLIDKHDKVSLIDMELAWSAILEQPDPPFQLGTPGFMSPQQINEETPAIQDDIYALGALIATFLTNLNPFQLPSTLQQPLLSALFFFTNDEKMTTLIADCLRHVRSDRPSINAVNDQLIKYRETLQLNKSNALGQCNTPDIGKLKRVIQAGLIGLVLPKFVTPELQWVSIMKKENQIGNVLAERAVYPGWLIGMSGPLWLIGRAKTAGFDVQACLQAYENSWCYLDKFYFANPDVINPSLSTGSAGLAMAITEGLDSGLLTCEMPITRNLHSCFEQRSTLNTLYGGLAGQGIALLRALPWMDQVTAKIHLKSYISSLITSQNHNGSWSKPPGTAEISRPLGFSNGIAGIIWFLLAYHAQNPSHHQVTETIKKAIDHLITKSRVRRSNGWVLSESKTSILLLLIKAFELLKEPLYKTIVEANLKVMASKPVMRDFTLAGGLVSLGEMYLEAGKVLNSPLWQARSNWIASLFIHCFQIDDLNAGFWECDSPNSATADLFFGNAGIIHFLVRNVIDKLSHPLWPLY